MAIGGKPICILVVRVLLTVVVLAVCLLIASIGGFLNRCRGGYIDYVDLVGYWPAHVISRQTFSLATGLLVLIIGFHLRAGVVVWLLTQWSLFVGWGTYWSIGVSSMDYESRAGIFDWMLGRQEEGWGFTHRFVREYTGMSLRGLIWTAPQGYALQQLGFGWQYSLSGSLMSILYYTAEKMHGFKDNRQLDELFDGPEFYWGMFVWLVLIASCVSQLVYRIRQWVHHRSKDSVRDPNGSYQVFLYQSLNRMVLNFSYNVLFVVFWIVLSASTVFYSLIIQTDLKNKGQTFYGLFMSILALTVFMCWNWSASFTRWSSEKEKRKLKKSQSSTPSRINYLEQRGMPGLYEPSETDRLLPYNWPYSHPDKGFGESRPRIDNPSPIGFSSNSPTTQRNYLSHHHNHAPHVSPLSHTHRLLIKTWLAIDKWVYMDIFVLIRHAIGVLSIASLLCTISFCCYTILLDMGGPVFDPQYYVCINESIWNQSVVIP